MKSFCLFVIVLIAAFLGGGIFVFNFVKSNPDYFESVRIAAIENGCGGYDHKTGEFRWEKSLTIEEMTLPLEEGASSRSGGIYVDAPKPQRKPTK